MRLGLKGLALLLLLFLLVLCSSVPMCDARSGKHWRRSRTPSTSLLRRKGKAKSSGSSKHNSKRNQNPYQPSPGTNPNVPVSPSGSPAQGKGRQGPTMPTPSGGIGYALPLPPPPPPQSATAPTQSQDTVFNVVDFGAKGDGITDDTQVIIAASKVLCLLDAFQQYNAELEQMPHIKPTAMRFYGSSNVTVTGITIVNSSQCHLKFDSCQGVMVHNITISSPENSPNTDGIHLFKRP